jgi:hypothetical protein
VFVHPSILNPLPGKEGLLIDSMHRFGEADGAIPGCARSTRLRDRRTGTLVGLAIWESEEAFEAGVPRMRAAVDGDDLLAWERGVPEAYVLEPV